MANETIGTVKCPFCRADGFVRKNVKGKLYYLCERDGIVQPNGEAFQNWMLENCRIGSPADPAPEPAPAPAPAPAPPPEAPKTAPQPKPAPAAKASGFRTLLG